MRRFIASLIVVTSLGLAAGNAIARDVEDGKLIVRVTKDGHYQVGDFQGDKVGFYGVVGDKWQTAHDKGKDIVGLLLKKGENATAEQKHIVYVTARQLKIDAFVEIDGKEQKIEEAAPAPAPAAQPAPAAAAAPAAQPEAAQH